MNRVKNFVVGWYWLSSNRSYLVSDRRRGTTLQATVCCDAFERQETDCSLQHSIMLCFWELCVFLASIFLGVRGQCPAQCKCPSSQVANCASLALKNIPTERCVEHTSLSQLKYRLMLGSL